MRISEELLGKIESDLSLNARFEKGKDIYVNNCWHFYTDGSDVDMMFYEESDFIDGMNRIYFISKKYNIIILAFVLMDTHIHFILYGSFNECNKFIHAFINRTSQYIAYNHKDNRKLEKVSISHQKVDTLYYLKIVICYTVKNPVVAGLPYLYHNYPWSSGALYFCPDVMWTTPLWKQDNNQPLAITKRDFRESFKTRSTVSGDIRVLDRLIFPGEYVAYEITERVFRTCKGFSYFLSKSKEDEVDSMSGKISHLSIPLQEMRQHRNEFCEKMFGVSTIRTLCVPQRIKLARVLKSQFNSSPKQISRLCGLIYNEVKEILN